MALAGAGLLLLAVLGWVQRDAIRAWIVGYEVVWMERGVVPRDVNRHGQAAVGRAVYSPARRDAGIWDVSTRVFVPLEPVSEEKPFADAEAINDHGHVVGCEFDEKLREGSGILWRGTSSPIRIDHPEGLGLRPLDVNDRGQVVGMALVDDALFVYGHAFLWSETSGFIDLHSKLDCSYCSAVAVNNRGWIVGAWHGDDNVPWPFLWRGGEFSTLLDDDSLAPGGAAAVDINDRGEALINLFERSHAGPFLWSPDDGLRHLPVPDGCESAVGWAIDPEGRILMLGEPTDGADRYYLYSRGELRRLPELSEKSGATRYWNLGPGGWLAGSVREDDDLIDRGFLLRLLR